MKYRNLAVPKQEMHYLRKPHGFATGMAWGNLGYQMRYSAEVLEDELVQASTPHVIQLVLEGEDAQNPSSWQLFADGIQIADGTGEYARALFCNHETAFLDLCREATLSANLTKWTKHEYDLLKTAERITCATRNNMR